VLLIGLGGGCVESPLSVIVAKAYPERSAQVLNLTQIFYNVGAVLGPVGVSFVVAWGLGWRMGFGLGCLLSLATLGYAWWTLRDGADASRHATASHRTGSIPWGWVALLALAMFLYVGGEMTFAQWSPNFLEETHRVAPDWAARALSGFWLGMMVGRALYIVLVRQWGHVPPILLSALLAVISGLVMMGAGSGWRTGIACMATGFFLGGTWPTLLSYSGTRAPHRTGTIFAAMAAMGAAGALVVPPLAGLLAQSWGRGLRTVLVVAVVSIGAEGLLVLGIHLWERLRRAPLNS